jgi:hypothetical protein
MPPLGHFCLVRFAKAGGVAVISDERERRRAAGSAA